MDPSALESHKLFRKMGDSMKALSSTGINSANSQQSRRFFQVTSIFVLAVAVIGFAPNSIAILSGSQENPELVIHIHAAAMFGWLSLFVAQCFLAVNNINWHRRLGMTAFLLGPLIIGLMMYLAISRFPGGEKGHVVALLQTERVVLFSTFFIVALLARYNNLGMHKRMMLFASLVPLDAAINRMPWLPSFGLEWDTPLWMLALLVPIVVHDIRTLGRLHKATLLGGGTIFLFWMGILLTGASPIPGR